MEQEKTNRIGQDFTLFQLLKFVFPSILTNLFSQLFKTLDDGLFVSRFVGKTALAGINILNPLHFFQFSLNNLFALGASNISSRKMGEGKQLEAKQVFTRVVISAFAVGGLVAVLANLFAVPLLKFLGADEALIGFGLISLRTVFLITPVSLVNVVFNSYYSTAGKPSMGLLCSILNGTTNVALDILLIVILKIGVLGACISTVAGEAVIFIVGLIFFTNKNNEIYFVPPQGDIVPTTLAAWKTGLPQFINSLSLSLTSLIANYQLLRYVGNDGIAANSIVTDLRRILSASFFGYITCVGPIISYNYGARNRPRLKKLMKQNITCWLGGALLLTSLGLIFRDRLISIFMKEGENSRTFYELTYFGLTLEFCGLTFFSGVTSLSRMLVAVNLRKASLVMAIIRNLVVRTGLLFLLPKIFGPRGIWAVSPGCELLVFCFGVFIFMKNRHEFGFGPPKDTTHDD